MELTIQIPMEGGDTTSVKEIMESLSKKDKKDIATSVVKEWLQNELPFERSLYEQKVIKDLRKDSSYRGFKGKDVTDEQIKASYGFKDKMKDFKSTREIFIEESIQEMKSKIKEHILEVVKSHEETEKINKIVSESISEEIPKMVMNLFSLHLVSEFSKSMENMYNFDGYTQNIQNTFDDIFRKLNNNY